MMLSLAAAVSALALAGMEPRAAKAADMGVPEGQAEGPPPGYYGAPPGQEGYAYPPPPAVYGYPPPRPLPYYAYGAPPFVAYPGPYYGRWPYWRGFYGPRFAYGYGYWGRGYRRW